MRPRVRVRARVEVGCALPRLARAPYHGWLARLSSILLLFYVQYGMLDRKNKKCTIGRIATQLVLVVASDSESIGPGLARKVLRFHSGLPLERPKSETQI